MCTVVPVTALLRLLLLRAVVVNAQPRPTDRQRVSSTICLYSYTRGGTFTASASLTFVDLCTGARRTKASYPFLYLTAICCCVVSTLLLLQCFLTSIKFHEVRINSRAKSPTAAENMYFQYLFYLRPGLPAPPAVPSRLSGSAALSPVTQVEAGLAAAVTTACGSRSNASCYKHEYIRYSFSTIAVLGICGIYVHLVHRVSNN